MFLTENSFSIFVVIKITAVLNDCDCVGNASLLVSFLFNLF